MRVRAVLINPNVDYFLRYHLIDADGNEQRMVVDKTVQPASYEEESTEFDRGNFKIKAYFMNGPIDEGM